MPDACVGRVSVLAIRQLGPSWRMPFKANAPWPGISCFFFLVGVHRVQLKHAGFCNTGTVFRHFCVLLHNSDDNINTMAHVNDAMLTGYQIAGSACDRAKRNIVLNLD